MSYRDGVPGNLIGLVKTFLEQCKGNINEPVATKNRMGWIIFGRTETYDLAQPHRVPHACTRSQDDDLRELVRQFLSTGRVGVSFANVTNSADDQRARER